MFPVPRPVRRKRTAGRYAASERPVSPPPWPPRHVRRPAAPPGAPPGRPPGRANASLAPRRSAPPGQRCELAGPAAVPEVGADPLRHRCFCVARRQAATSGAR